MWLRTASPRQSHLVDCFGLAGHRHIPGSVSNVVVTSRRAKGSPFIRAAAWLTRPFVFNMFRGYYFDRAAAPDADKSNHSSGQKSARLIDRCLLGGRADRVQVLLGFGRPRGLPAPQRESALDGLPGVTRILCEQVRQSEVIVIRRIVSRPTRPSDETPGPRLQPPSACNRPTPAYPGPRVPSALSERLFARAADA